MRRTLVVIAVIVAVLATQAWRVAYRTQSPEIALALIGLLVVIGALLAVYVLYETAIRVRRSLPARAAHFWLSDLRSWVAGRERENRP